MNIIHVISGYLPDDSGGTQIHLRDLALQQQAAGHQVMIFARTGQQERAELELLQDEQDGIPVTRLNYNFQDCDSFEKLYRHEQIDDRFAQVVHTVSPDVVHFHHLTCLSTSMIAVAHEFGAATIVTVHDYWLVCPRGQRWHPVEQTICETLDRDRCASCLSLLWPHLLPMGEGAGRTKAELGAWEDHIKRMLRLCDRLIFPSTFHRDRFVDFGVAEAKCRVIPHGLPTQQLLAEPRGRRAVQRVGFIGTVLPSKGVHILIEAFALLARRDLELHIHGADLPYHEITDYRQQLEDAIPAGCRVEFHGAYESAELTQILAALDLLVVPPLWWETFCLTAREGALAGLPVIAPRLGGLTEAVDEGMVLGFEPGDARDLARVIAQVCDEPELRDQLSRQAGLVRDISQAADDTEAVYREVDTQSILGPRKIPTLVSLVIPTWNAGPEFPEILATMMDQDFDGDLEVIVIDSGSRDGTLEFLESQPVRLIRIPNSEFNHGLTRNRGIQEASGDIVVLATQDARPNDRLWLRSLVECYEDSRVAGAYSRQLPRPEANPFIRDRLSHWAAAQEAPRVQQVSDWQEFEALEPLEQLGRVAFDNVSSSVRRSVALEIPFRRRQFGEDLDWAHRTILAGHHIVFQPASKVIHSHNNSIWYEFKRVYLDHQNLNRLFGVHTIQQRENLMACVQGAIGHLKGVVERDERLGTWSRMWWKMKAYPFGYSQNLAQYLGARSVRKLIDRSRLYRWLDSTLRRGV